MRAKLTILMCALLVLALGASQAHAQGYLVSRSIEDVVQHGKNQSVGEIQLDYSDTGDIDAGGTITVTFGGLPISAVGVADCTSPVDCDAAPAINEDKDTLTIETTGTPGTDAAINLDDVRVDVSSLDAGDEIMATISTSAPSGLIPISQSRRGTVTAVVGTVKAGLTVGIAAASRLICNLTAIDDMGTADTEDDAPVGGVPMITVTEGFDDAWETALGGTTITIATLNLPKGVELRFPQTVTFTDPDDANDTWATLTLSGDNAANVLVGEDVEDNTDDGSMVSYDYSVQDATEAAGEMDSFEIPITVVTGDIASGGGGIADIWAILGPQPADDDADVGTVLSYLKDPVTDPDTADGDFLNVAECVTYLLFPFLTCGAHMDWTTSIAIANTTLDDGVFGLSAGATAQAGSIMLHTFPRSMMNDDGEMMMMEPGVEMLAHDLAAGDTYSAVCDDIVPGFEGYAIAKAGFRHAHGVAYVLGNFAGGASRDVAHGYLALVIPDPEFSGGGRAAVEGETLGQ